MKLYDKLMGGHQKINEALDELESYKFTDPSLFKAISVLKSHVLIHHRDEKKFLEPLLRKMSQNNPFVKTAIKILDNTSKESNDIMNDFFDQFKSKSMNQKTYDAELQKLSIFLKNTMKEKESILYKIIENVKESA